MPLQGLQNTGEPSPGPSAAIESLYEDAPCGLLVVGADGLVVSANRTFCRWVGRDPADLSGRATLEQLLVADDRAFFNAHWNARLQAQGSVSEIRLSVLHVAGHIIPMVWNATRRVDHGVVFDQIAVFIAEDRQSWVNELLQARKRAEELLEQEQAAQRALAVARQERDRQQAVAEDRALFAEQMVAIVSHDLRNPLSVVRMSAYLIGLGDLQPRQQKALERLNNATGRATRLIGDLLDFSQGRMGSGLQVDRAPLDLHALVESAVDDLRASFPARTIVTRRFGDGACTGSADRLDQLIGNLVANAVSYGDADRPVIVTSTIRAGDFSIAVSNEGPVISAELLPRLFDPMTRGVRVDNADHGVGLGLFIVREIARAHGGHVTVDSSAEAGTTFTVSLPRGITPASASTGAPAVPSGDPLQAHDPQHERGRQAALDQLQINPYREVAYDDIARLAAEACDAPIALMSLVDGNRQWFKARVGLDTVETPREYAFCDHAIRDSAQVLVVEDATADARFSTNPLVTGEPGIRFYAGAPLVTSGGHALGTVCVIDRIPRTLDAAQIKLLEFLARQAVARLEER